MGSEHVCEKGEALGENQRTQKDKEWEFVNVQPSHVAPSQKDACINKETNLLLSIPSQKGLNIENNSQPGAQNTGLVTKAKQITPYVRKKKGNKTQKALGEHTVKHNVIMLNI